MILRYILVLFLAFSLHSFIAAQSDTHKKNWVDSIFKSLSQDDKIGQLFMMRAFSKTDNSDVQEIKNLINKYKIGGLCFFQGSPTKQVQLTNYYQGLSKVPLLISIDGEWGLGMRFPETTISFPKQLTLGAIQNNALVKEFGEEVGNHLKRMGIHLNFAPVVDVNNNPKNPVINDRSFGEDKYNVAAKSFAYMQGMMNAKVLACAKHFPGHGDTDSDSHFTLPSIKHPIDRMQDIELFPFKTLSQQGLPSIMTAHLNIPSMDDRLNRPTSLSQKVVTDILRNEIGFKGLIFTDAMEMKGVANYFKGGSAEAEAFQAGNDVLLLSENIGLAITKIKEYLSLGKITNQQLDASVYRILEAKYDAGLASLSPIKEEGLLEFLNSNTSLSIKARLIESALTLVSDKENLIPLEPQVGVKMASLCIGSLLTTPFQYRLNDFASFDHFNTTSEVSTKVYSNLVKEMSKYEIVVIGLLNMSKSSIRNFGLTDSEINLVKELAKQQNVVLCVFGNPYALKLFDDVPTVLQCFEDDDMFQDVAAQSLFGTTSIIGKLPITASDKYHFNLGIMKPALNKLGYSLPERVGLNSKVLAQIDDIALDIIRTKAAPGCQVLVAKDGKIVWDKAYGNQRYNTIDPVTKNTVYDLASCTKILATTLAMMKMQEFGKMSLKSPINNYVSGMDTTNKSGIIIGDMMAHVSGLHPWIPFYTATLELGSNKNKVASPKYYSNVLKEGFTIPVANKMFIRNDYRDTVFSIIYKTVLRSKRNYRYSDLGLMLTAKSIENASGMKLNRVAEEYFYKPLGLQTMGFLPLNRIPLSDIAPTEVDTYWRNQEVRGTVHDMASAMLGGIAGHAGLFSNAKDVAILMQMLLNGGTYGGLRLLKPQTISEFTTRHPASSRRAYGFDMQEIDLSKSNNMSEFASEWTYGHTGFTGTATYVDPVHNIVYVFLCNRTFPSKSNNSLNKYDYRTKIQSVIYQALMFPV